MGSVDNARSFREALGLVRAALLLVAFLSAALLAGTAPAAAAPDTRAMVLKLSDLPVRATFEGGSYVDNARAAALSPSTTLADFNRQGRINGYTADFWLDSTTAITTQASVFKTAKGSSDSLHHNFATETKPQRTSDGVALQFKRVAAGVRIGDEARTYSATFKNGATTLAVFAIHWRYRTVKAQFFLVGLPGGVSAAAATRMARTQQARIAAALA
jgi:hypothetical protein